MQTLRILLAVAATLAVSCALPATSVQETGTNSFWKGTPMDSMVGELEAECANNDTVSCIKFRVLSVLDHVFRKDTFQVTESVSVVRNSFEDPEPSGRSQSDEDPSSQFLDSATRYLQRHDVLVQLPFGARASVSPRALDDDQLDIKLDFSGRSSNEVAEARHRRKGKLRKMLVPIMVFLLLKAMTLIPLAIGVLGLKAWNALQLGFFSFIISISLAIFQLCKKIAADSAPVSQLSAHVGAPWDGHYAAAARALHVPEEALHQDISHSTEGDAQVLAYRGH